MVTQDVAVNSHSDALLTLIISDQFFEIKVSACKKFDKENLYQQGYNMERFWLSDFVVIIAARSHVDLSPLPLSPLSVYPQSFAPLYSSMTAIARLLMSCLLALSCYTLVDWLNHAFITNFNNKFQPYLLRPATRVCGPFADDVV
ncbi:hypothetical protein BGZ98_003720 [Dissophora globulifera]|nr:hypothetical protein BGZ98_003720 [Dissophora globulifera]